MRYETPEFKYMEKYFSLKDPYLEKVKLDLERKDLSFMSVSSVEARMLQFFVRTLQVKTVVEIGSLYGYSAMAMALALPKDGRIFCFEKDEERATKIKENFREADLSDLLTLHSGDALEELKKIENEAPFDLVFIDANKSAYVDYLDWAEAHTRKGSLIIGDNTFLFGALWNESRGAKVGAKQIEMMNLFNARLADSEKYDSIMIPTLEGMTVGRRKF